MKKVAIIGFGFMGRTHYGAWRKCLGAKVVAVCVTNPKHLAAKVKGNIAGAADNSALPKSIRIFDNYEKLLASGGFDIVDLTVPTHLHAPMTIAALQSGYHVLCEKPMALTVRDCDRMLAAAKAAKKKLLVAQCVRFFPEYAFVRDLVKSGRYGKVVAADFTRYIAPPKWSAKGSNWFFDEKKSGGVLFDVQIHDLDYIVGTFGKPKSISAAFHRNAKGCVDHTTAAFAYKDALITTDSSFAPSASFVWEGSGRVFFEKATVYFGPFYKAPLTVYPEVGKPFSPKLPKRTGYEAEIAYFLGMVEGKKQEKILTAKDARDSIALLIAERRSAQSGKRVLI